MYRSLTVSRGEEVCVLPKVLATSNTSMMFLRLQISTMLITYFVSDEKEVCYG